MDAAKQPVQRYGCPEPRPRPVRMVLFPWWTVGQATTELKKKKPDGLDLATLTESKKGRRESVGSSMHT